MFVETINEDLHKKYIFLLKICLCGVIELQQKISINFIKKLNCLFFLHEHILKTGISNFLCQLIQSSYRYYPNI